MSVQGSGFRRLYRALGFRVEGGQGFLFSKVWLDPPFSLKVWLVPPPPP